MILENKWWHLGAIKLTNFSWICLLGTINVASGKHTTKVVVIIILIKIYTKDTPHLRESKWQWLSSVYTKYFFKKVINDLPEKWMHTMTWFNPCNTICKWDH